MYDKGLKNFKGFVVCVCESFMFLINKDIILQ